jgi:hypothetical protein
LTGLVRDQVEKLVAEDAASSREREVLERGFERFRFTVGKRSWKQADLYGRSCGVISSKYEPA